MRRMISLIALSLVLALLSTVINTGNAKAVTASDWRPGRIVDDAVFTDKNALSIAQIQQFLDSKMPTCDTHGVNTISYNYPFSGGPSVTTSKALYSYRKGNGAVTVIKPSNIPDAEHTWYTDNTWFRCINNYWENPETGLNNYANRPTPSGGKSAANLIWDAAQEFNISPKVLLITLQKEQSLVTDTWPFQNQYLYAMGAYCPDGPNGANCNPAYAGFGKQIRESASLFRYYLDNMYQPWWSNKKPGNNNILWQVTYKNGALTNCGGSSVYIENMATAALYTYTPYQPNQAALNNMYGEGDYCSAYGNRNFWRQFHDWFGTTYTDGYVAQFNSQSAYPTPGYGGQSKSVSLRYKNLGSTRWYSPASAPSGISPVRLAATSPINRASPFSYGWHSSGRPTNGFSRVYEANGTTLATNQNTVEPGQIAEFSFSFVIPYALKSGTYREHFQPILEGASKWAIQGNNTAWFDITVLPNYQATHVRQSPYPTMTQNGYVDYYIDYRNTGVSIWYDDANKPTNTQPINLATTGQINRNSTFGATWHNRARPAVRISRVFEANGTTLATDQTKVSPGQIARFAFVITVPEVTAPGTYREYFQPIREGASDWSLGGVSWIDITIRKADFKATFHSQSTYPTLNKGQSTASYLQYKNTGNTTWYDNTTVVKGIVPIRLAVSNPMNKSSVFSNGWPNAGRPNQTFSKVYESNGVTLSPNQGIVNPGQIARYEFDITAPWTVNAGTHREYIQPILDGSSSWNIGGLAWFDIKVN